MRYMKVLQVNCVYQKGSTGKIVHSIHKCLQKEGIESVVCYGRGEKIVAPGVYKFCSELESKFYHLLNKFGWRMYDVCPLATYRLIKIIRREKPDLVHLHCINGYSVNVFKLLTFLGDSNIKTVITHHAEFLYTGNCGHSYDCEKFQREPGCYDCHILKEAAGTSLIDRTNSSWHSMKTAFSHFQSGNLLCTAVSPWVVKRMSLSPICNSFDCRFVTNGVETDVFRLVSQNAVVEVRARIPHPERKMILYVSACFTTDKGNIKGGYFIRSLSEMMPQYQFVVVSSYIGKVENLPENVTVWGRAKNQMELAALYNAADVTVITSRRETFSMVVAESLCCGTPIVGFEAGGPESIALKEYSEFVEYGNLEDLAAAVERFADKDWDSEAISQQAAGAYSKESMTHGYLDVYKQILK